MNSEDHASAYALEVPVCLPEPRLHISVELSSLFPADMDAMKRSRCIHYHIIGKFSVLLDYKKISAGARFAWHP